MLYNKIALLQQVQLFKKIILGNCNYYFNLQTIKNFEENQKVTYKKLHYELSGIFLLQTVTLK